MVSGDGTKTVLFGRVPPKLVYFYGRCLPKNNLYGDLNDGLRTAADEAEVDDTDRLPRSLVVRRFDVFCFVFSAASYLLDVGSDAVTAYIHYRAGRFWAFLFISLLTVLPSIALNTISLIWWVDDAKARRTNNTSIWSRSLLLRLMACIFQVGPVIWYVDAAMAAVRFRHCNDERDRRVLYCKMVEADRDASLLRFFEAFLESAPQLLVQGVVLAHSFFLLGLTQRIPTWMVIHAISVVISLVSVSWSISIQHRSLRIARPDKLNLSPFGTLLQLSWRCLTISARYLLLVLFVLVFHFWTVLLITTHYIISLIHIAALQRVDSEPSYLPLEFGLLLICAAVHLFTPFNMAEGPTRIRYTVAYAVETVENLVLAYLLLEHDEVGYPYKDTIIPMAFAMFVTGIFLMLLYYSRFHPTRSLTSTGQTRSPEQAVDQREDQLPSTTETGPATLAYTAVSELEPSQVVPYIDSDSIVIRLF